MLILLGILGALIIGAAVKFGSDFSGSFSQITRNEFIIGALVCAFFVVPMTVWIGGKVAQGNNLTFHENWNGYEMKAVEDVTTCRKSKSGNCSYNYNCDPYTEYYTVTVVDRAAYTDADGNYHAEISHQETRSRTAWHDCPYVTKEYNYSIKDSFGDSHRIGSTRFATNPKRWYGDGDEDYDGMPSVPRGAPKFWKEAKARIDAGENGGVTKRMDYDNYVLASQTTILKQYSGAIAKLKKKGLLPKVQTKITEPYLADRFYTVGLKVPNEKLWDTKLGQLNAGLGSDLQGDLHFVLVDMNDVSNMDEYLLALLAYWQGPEFKKDALSKNTILVVVGTKDGKTIEWAGAKTGMPVGNAAMLQDFRTQLRGATLDPLVVLGNPKPNFKGKDLTIDNGDGIVENVLWGTNKFKRVCMACEGEEDSGVGFTYLNNQIEITTGQKAFILFVAMLLSGGVWAALMFAGEYRSSNHDRNVHLINSRYL